MSELIIIAGPQAAGKSTIIAKLVEQYQGISPLFANRKNPVIFPMQESRQIVVHKYMLLGGIFMSKEHEKEVMLCDFKRMKILENRNDSNTIYLDECNIFTLAHAQAHGIRVDKSQWNKYMEHLLRLNAKVIFLNITARISWERRRRKYKQRLIYFPENDHDSIMREFEKYLTRVQGLLEEIYYRLEIPKCMIDADRSSKDVIEEVSQSIAKLSTSF